MNKKDRNFHVGTVVRHFKGRLYRIEDFARHSETGELMVVYRQCFPPFLLFVRPESIFCSRVDREKYPNAAQAFRYESVTKVEAKAQYKEAQRGARNGAQVLLSDCCADGNTLLPET